MHKFFKLVSLSLIIILLSGCKLVYINSQSIDDITNLLGTNSGLKSVSFDGYSYFLPQGVNLKENKTANSILYYSGYKMYLYVDMVAYYHKHENTYEVSKTSYYSKKIEKNDKDGYLEINEVSDKYFIEYVYNYSKIEGYVEKKDLNKVLTIMSYVLNSVRFNDKILDSIIGEDYYNYTEETFNIFKANGNDTSNYLDIVTQYDEGRKNIKNEDILEIDGKVE